MARMRPMSPDIETLVIGAGVVGLACARALAAAGQEVLVLEGEERIGAGVSARNSEVIPVALWFPFCPGGLERARASPAIAPRRTA